MNDSDSDNSGTTNLRKENEKLKKELKALTLYLAALAHKEYQVPDGSIREDYEKICRAIETWIDYAPSDESGDFRNRFREALKMEEKTHRLRDIGFVYQLPATSDRTLHFLGGLDMLHYFILSLTIGKYVFSEILMTPYPIGVTEPQQATFLSIEEEMSRMGKAKSKITQWRSDTLTALCSSKSYQDEQKRQLLSIQNALGKDLSFWCGNSGYQRLKDRLHREIIDPSVRVHQEMKCSTRKYDLIRESDAQFKRSSSSEQYASHIVKEVKTWKTMTSDGTERVLQCLYPGIVVYDMEAEERSELLGPVMAVYKRASPQARRSATSSARSSFHAEISMKEPRDHGHHKIATNAPKRIGSSINAFVEGISRKSKDDRRSPEPSSSHPSRRASRDTSTKQVQYSSLSYGQTVSYSQSTQPTEDMPIPFAPSAYTRTVTGVPCEGATAEVVEPREMTYTSSPEEWSDYYHGRPSVPDGTYIERFDE